MGKHPSKPGSLSHSDQSARCHSVPMSALAAHLSRIFLRVPLRRCRKVGTEKGDSRMDQPNLDSVPALGQLRSPASQSPENGVSEGKPVLCSGAPTDLQCTWQMPIAPNSVAKMRRYHTNVVAKCRMRRYDVRAKRATCKVITWAALRALPLRGTTHGSATGVLTQRRKCGIRELRTGLRTQQDLEACTKLCYGPEQCEQHIMLGMVILGISCGGAQDSQVCPVAN